jgi:hypothetical protein
MGLLISYYNWNNIKILGFTNCYENKYLLNTSSNLLLQGQQVSSWTWKCAQGNSSPLYLGMCILDMCVQLA